FVDGNGRTGRILVVLYLVEQGLLNAPVLFLSGEILKERESYYLLLQKTRETNDFSQYLLWFIEIVYRASVQPTIRANNVRNEMLIVKNELRKSHPVIYSQDLVNLLFRTPVLFANQLVDSGIAGSLSTAHTYLKELERAGIIFRSSKRYNRKVGYVSSRLMNALSGEIDLS
ncbi:MAG: hypothetical protein JKY98_01275, partial [Gammaproteobacteria bacterium]|nr:hypothetical protein [Gammaproteobacteria bacterium]